MATISNGNRQFIPTNQLPVGAGASGFVDEVTGILVGIEPRPGKYPVTDAHGNPVIDPETGQQMMRPNSWTAHFEDGRMFSWPTYEDKSTGEVRMWDKFDRSINLAMCVEQRIAIHMWKDARKFTHLELAGPAAQADEAPWA